MSLSWLDFSRRGADGDRLGRGELLRALLAKNPERLRSMSIVIAGDGTMGDRPSRASGAVWRGGHRHRVRAAHLQLPLSLPGALDRMPPSVARPQKTARAGAISAPLDSPKSCAGSLDLAGGNGTRWLSVVSSAAIRCKSRTRLSVFLTARASTVMGKNRNVLFCLDISFPLG